MSTTGCGWCPEPEEGRGNPGWGRARSQGARQRGRRRHSDVSTVYLLLGYLVHGVHTANTTQAPQGRQRPGLRSYGRAGAPPRPPLLPPTWPGLDPHTHTKRPGRSPPPKGHPGGSLRRPGNPGPPLHLRTRWCRASRRDAIPFPSPRGCSPGWLGWKRGVSSGGEGAGAGAGGAPGRGSVGMVGHVKGLPGGPRVVPAALVLAQRRQPVHLQEKEMSAAPHGVCPPPPPTTTVGYGPWGPPVPGDKAFRVPQLIGTRFLASPMPLQQRSPWHPPPMGTEPSVSPISLGTTLGVSPSPHGTRLLASLLPQGQSSRCPVSPEGAWPIPHGPWRPPFPRGDAALTSPHGDSTVPPPWGPWSSASLVLWGTALGVSRHPVGHGPRHPLSRGAQPPAYPPPWGHSPRCPHHARGRRTSAPLSCRGPVLITSARLTNSSVAAVALSRCPRQALSADACSARP